ncbi:MAG: polysaccharide biosynthesis protein [Bacteroidota bacterium]
MSTSLTHTEGKKIAITGGTGTIGHALVQKILEQYKGIEQIRIISRDEVKQMQMMERFSYASLLDFHLGDVRDLARMKELIAGMDLVIHAAALKHVVMAEKNPSECFKTNVEGSENVIASCLAADVKRAIFISTDKACKPVGVYGRSKKEAEELFLQAQENGSTVFKTVRLGNIIGSRGSVFEVFERQRQSGVLTVSHPDATRFCIEQEEAASYVLYSLTNSQTGLLESPKMRAYSILEIARQIAPDCEIVFSGLRPGDKLHEEIDGVSSASALKRKGESMLAPH